MNRILKDIGFYGVVMPFLALFFMAVATGLSGILKDAIIRWLIKDRS